LLALLSLVGSGCGGGSAKQQSASELPVPLTLADVNKQRSDSPARTVFHLWFWAQWGGPVNVLDAYAPSVTRRVGALKIADAYARLRPTVLAARPRVVAQERNRDGSVTVAVLAVLAGPARKLNESFTLRKQGGRWLVVYDTLLADGLSTDAQLVVDGSGSRSPSPAGLKAGDLAAKRYRHAAAAGRP
jgi:hypothetical protein